MPHEHAEQINQYLLQFEWWVALLIVAGIGAIQFLAALWLKSRLEESIRLEYSKKLEEYRYQIEVRKRAEQVARYLSLRAENASETRPSELNQIAWELALWLPADLYRKLAHAVVDTDGHTKWKPLLIEIRKVLLQDPDDKLIAENIIHHSRQ